ncbi:glycogen debranching protein, partial [Ruminococcus champanellensis]
MAVITNMPLIPVDTISGFPVRPGNHLIQGATAMPNAVNFTISSANATSCELLLFHRKEKTPYAVIPIPASYRIGDVFSIIVFGLDITEFEYAYRMDGPHDPRKGLLFNKERILLDPYARAVTGQHKWGENAANDHQYHARVVTESFDWGDMRSPELPLRDLIIYEMHVRGFTRSSTSGVAHPGTFAGILEKLPHLLALGINAVELMPVFEFNELEDARIIDGKTLYNYWGYNTVSFFSPNTSYSSENEYNREGNELKQMIRVLHEHGIEVILDVVFNHTAEGNEQGSAFSFKGIDNNVYYMLTPDGSYFNFSGCGNTFNCNHPVVQQFILNCLRYWATEYRIDGFRFDLAAIMGRNEDGSPMRNPPLLRNLAYDPVLSKVKLIAEAWDAGGLYQVGSFSSLRRWAEWNGRYRDDLRCFLKGDAGMAQAAINRITGSTDLYDPVYRGDNASVNFLTCHDGFTLYDLYAYNTKHNEANGWNNTDGDNCGNSWNCGAEGDTDNQEIRALRMRLIKNAFATLLCSRGAAMFLAGDEFC